jgi:hypothetical protein
MAEAPKPDNAPADSAAVMAGFEMDAGEDSEADASDTSGAEREDVLAAPTALDNASRHELWKIQQDAAIKVQSAERGRQSRSAMAIFKEKMKGAASHIHMPHFGKHKENGGAEKGAGGAATPPIPP